MELAELSGKSFVTIAAMPRKACWEAAAAALHAIGSAHRLPLTNSLGGAPSHRRMARVRADW